MKNNIETRPAPFTQISNTLLNDDKISLKAKGLYSFMYSKPFNWYFTTRSMAKQLKEGRESILTALNELKKAGWVSYKKHADGTGTYLIEYEARPVEEAEAPPEKKPKSENPTQEKKPKSGKPTVGKPDPINNKDLISNKESTHIKNNKKGLENLNRVEALLTDQYFLEQTAITLNCELDQVKKELAEFIQLAKLEGRFESTQFKHPDFVRHFHNTLRLILEKAKKGPKKGQKKKAANDQNELSPAQEAHQGAGERANDLPTLKPGIDF